MSYSEEELEKIAEEVEIEAAIAELPSNLLTPEEAEKIQHEFREEEMAAAYEEYLRRKRYDDEMTRGRDQGEEVEAPIEGNLDNN